MAEVEPMSKRLEALEKMIAAGTKDPFVSYGRAMELRSLGRVEEAVSAFRDLRERHPEYVPGWHQSGILLRDLGRTDEARAAYREGIARARAAGNPHALAEMQADLEAMG